ncbi:MAG: hypothetical protein ACJ8ER_12445 [Allosphingosinicella sp.]
MKIVPSEFSLKPPPASSRVTPQDCRREVAAGEIVVCGHDSDAYRYKEIKPPPGIEVDSGGVIGLDFGGARVEPEMTEVAMPDGRVSKRIMVTVKVPF